MTGQPPPLPPSLLTAEKLIAWRGGVPAGVPDNVILTHQESLFRALVPRFRAKRVSGLFPQVYILPGTDGRIAIAGRIGIGGPATAMAVEELAVAGARRIVMIDVAGGILPGLPAEAVVVVTQAISADGTSPHYLGRDDDSVAGSEVLTVALDTMLRRDGEVGGTLQAVPARVASVDAPFRETEPMLEAYRSRGVVAIDMETAAFYASATARGIMAASLLVIGDQFSNGRWIPPASQNAVRAQVHRVSGIVRSVLLA